MLAQLPRRRVRSRARAKQPAGRAQLRETCERILVQGYAYQVSPLESGGYDLAFPVRDPTRSVLASVAIEGLIVSVESSARKSIRRARSSRRCRTSGAREAGALVPHYEHVDPDDIRLG